MGAPQAGRVATVVPTHPHPRCAAAVWDVRVRSRATHRITAATSAAPQSGVLQDAGLRVWRGVSAMCVVLKKTRERLVLVLMLMVYTRGLSAADTRVLPPRRHITRKTARVVRCGAR